MAERNTIWLGIDWGEVLATAFWISLLLFVCWIAECAGHGQPYTTEEEFYESTQFDHIRGYE